jgi:flavodoxin
VNTIVIYLSRFGNTRRVAEEIAEAFDDQGGTRIMPADRVTAAELADADLVIVGSPTHRMNLPQELRPWLEVLPRRALRGVWVAAFDTSYKMSRWLAPFTAAPKLDRKLRKLGGRRAVRPETFHVTAREGPLYEGEIERARAWGASLLAAVTG